MKIRRSRFPLRLAVLGGAILLSCFTASPSGAQTPLPTGSQVVYDDALENGWQNYGWATLDYSSSSTVHGTGGTSISVDAGGYQALYVHHDALDATSFTGIVFWIHGGTQGGQSLQVQATVNGSAQTAVDVPAPKANAWQQVTISLDSLGIAGQSSFDGFWIQNKTGNTLPTFYVDDIALVAQPPPSNIALQVNAASVIRQIDPRIFGLNTAIWDSQLGTSASVSLLSAIGTRSLRYPGGSAADTYYWQTNHTTDGTQWVSPFSTFATLAATLGAQPYIIVNYGSGTPEQAAAWVAYANGSPSSSVAIGTDSKGMDWHTVGYWASMRAASPLANDDGFNFLRVNHAAGYGFRYWEVGNECYGSWEHDEHSAAQDPYTYAQSFAAFRQKMLAVDSTVKIGAVVTGGQDSYGNGQHGVTNPRDNSTHTGWTPVVLANLKTLNALPHFLIFHDYPQEPGAESDSGLLAAASTLAATDAADLRQMLTDYIGGTAGTGIELALTELNSVTYNPGKQSVSLVDGLFYAETVASLATTEFNACEWWDFRNGSLSGDNNSSGLYGWRQFGDYGLVASGDRGDTAVNTPYPSYYAAKLLTHWGTGGDHTVAASSNYTPLTVHAAMRAGGHLCLLVVNKSAGTDLTAQIALSGFAPGSSTASLYRYGKPNDLNNADLTTTTLTGVGSSFSATFPAYSMTVIDLTKPAAASTPYAAWQSAHFTAAELAKPSISGDTADPDHDGLNNLMEYALNLDPHGVSTTGIPTVSTTKVDTANYLALTYTKVKADTDLTYKVEVSSDLVHWNSGSSYTTDHAVVDQGATQTVTTRDKTAISASATHRFIRLTVSRK